MAYERLVVDLAAIADEFFLEGKFDPNIRELGDKYYEGHAFSDGTLEDIRNRLPRIQRELEQKFGRLVTLVSKTYYHEFRKKPPTDKNQARRCIPLGGGNRPEGLRLRGPDSEDLIWQVSIEANYKTANGKVKKQDERVLIACDKGQLTEVSAAAILLNSQKQRQSEHVELQARIMAAGSVALLPGMHDDDEDRGN